MQTIQEHRVYVRQFWGGDWVLVPNLFANTLTWCCAPDMPEAVLEYKYGNILPYGGVAFAQRNKLEYLNYYVKVELDQDDDIRYWHGIIKQSIDEQSGGFNTDIQGGRQYLRAYGLEWLLANKQLTTSWTLANDGTDQEIRRCVGFNLGGGDTKSGRFAPNMSANDGTKGAYVFCDSLTNAQPWQANAIVEYLLTYQSPQDDLGAVNVPFAIDPAYADSLLSLSWWKIQLAYEGRSLKEVLDSILHRSRMMSYKIEVNTATNEVMLQPFTFVDQTIALPSGHAIFANPRQTTLNANDNALTRQCVVTHDIQPQYDAVQTRGERVGVCWTMNYSASASTMETDWDSSLQTAYNAGSPSATGQDYIKAQFHRNYRATDKFERVYRYWRVPASWNGTTPNGNPVVIDPDDVSISTARPPAKFWMPGLRFESYLPMRVDNDYETVTTVADTDSLTSDGRVPEFRRPFATHYISDAKRAFLMHKPESAQNYGEIPEQVERTWAVHVRMQEENLGVMLDVSGAPQHVITSNEFTAVDSADEADWIAELDWRNIYVTVYMLTDQFAEKTWPEDRPNPADVDRLKTIEIPGKRRIWIVPDTIIDVKEDGTLKKSAGGWIEDDGQELEDIARLTYDWYSRERRAVDMVIHTDDLTLNVGQLVTTLGAGGTLTTLNSVVTQISFDSRETMLSYRTQYAELDLRGL